MLVPLTFPKRAQMRTCFELHRLEMGAACMQLNGDCVPLLSHTTEITTAVGTKLLVQLPEEELTSAKLSSRRGQKGLLLKLWNPQTSYVSAKFCLHAALSLSWK